MRRGCCRCSVLPLRRQCRLGAAALGPQLPLKAPVLPLRQHQLHLHQLAAQSLSSNSTAAAAQNLGHEVTRVSLWCFGSALLAAQHQWSPTLYRRIAPLTDVVQGAYWSCCSCTWGMSTTLQHHIDTPIEHCPCKAVAQPVPIQLHPDFCRACRQGCLSWTKPQAQHGGRTQF